LYRRARCLRPPALAPQLKRDPLGGVASMPLLANIRTHFSRSFTDTVMWMFTWVEDQPAFLRPAYYGALFIWAFILFRGGLLVLPILLPVLFFTDRRMLWGFLLVFCLLAPAGGF